MSLILFITFMDRISCRSQDVKGVQFGDFKIGSLLFVDDVVLLASSVCDLVLSGQLLQDIVHVCERNGDQWNSQAIRSRGGEGAGV